MENSTTITCPYCESEIDAGTTYELTKQRTLATHKTRCSKKRYLGGTLALEYGEGSGGKF